MKKCKQTIPKAIASIAATLAALAMMLPIATVPAYAADNTISGTGEASGTVPVTINVTGLTIKATLPVSVDLTVNSDTLKPADVVTSTATIVNNTTANGVAIPIKVSYGKLGGSLTGVTVKDTGAAVSTDTNSTASEIALALTNGSAKHYLTPTADEAAYTDVLTSSNTYGVELYSSPGFKYGAKSVSASMVFKISL